MMRCRFGLWALLGSVGLACAPTEAPPALPSSVPAPLPRCEVPRRLALLDVEHSLTRAIGEVAEAHVVAVRVHPGRCGVDALEVLPECSVVERYAHLRPVQPALGVVSVLRAPPRASGRTLGLRGEGCEGATHVLAEIELGAEEPSSNCPLGVASSPASCRIPVAAELRRLAARPATTTSPMVRIPAGRRPSFEIDRFEVTSGQYQTCVEAGACERPGARDPEMRESARHCTFGDPALVEHPVNCVSFDEARAYCRFVEKRLPTDAEWTRAVSGSTKRRFPWGDLWPPPAAAVNISDENAKDRFPFWVSVEGYVDGFPETGPVAWVGSVGSAHGLYGAAGNVREWVTLRRSGRARGRFQWVRGGSFGEALPEAFEIRRKSRYARESRSGHIGFRCARSVLERRRAYLPPGRARVGGRDAIMLTPGRRGL